MKTSIVKNNFRNTRPWVTGVFSLFIVMVVQSAYAQKTYLTGQKTGDRFNSGVLPGNSGISAPFSAHNFLGALAFYYGDNILNSPTNTTPATLTAANVLSATFVKVSGADVYAQFRNTGNNSIPANTTTYFKIKEKPTSTGLGVSVGGLLGLTEFNNIVGQGYSGASNYSTTSNVGAGSKNEGSVAGTATTRLLIDKAGEYYAAVTPNAAYNSVRLSVSIPAELLDVATVGATFNVNIYNAFTEELGGACSVRPKYSDIGSATGISLTTGALRLLELNDLVSNPKGAIDDSPTTYSSFSSGVANLGVANSILQTIYFDHNAAAGDAAKIHFALSEAIIGLDLLSGGVTFKAYKGASTTPVFTQSLQDNLNLIGLNIGTLLTVNSGYADVNTTFKPGVEFDRIEISLNTGLIQTGVIGDALRLFDVELSSPAPTLTSTITLGANNSFTVYAGQTLPVITATSATNNIVWYEGNSTTPLTTGASPLSLPVTSIAVPGTYVYYAAAQRPGCTNISAKVPVNVTVLPVNLATLPQGSLSSPYTFNTAVGTTTAGRTLKYELVGGALPNGLTLNQTTGLVEGTPSRSGNFTFSVKITDITTPASPLDAGTYQFNLTIITDLAIAGGPYPQATKGVPYSQQLPANLGASKGVAPYTYVIVPPSSGGARINATLALPSTFTLSSTGVLSGTPDAVGSSTFTVRATDAEGSTIQANFTILVENPLPVTLTSFIATKEGQTAQLKWSTTEETNSDRFEIERSQNGKNWDLIGTQKSNGESTSLKNYTFSDIKPLNGENLYRLKMIDRDATFAYSRIQSLTFASDLVTSFYPNPVAEKLIIKTDDFSLVKNVKIFDANGRTVYQSSATPSSEINVQNLSAGLYIVQMTSKSGAVISHKVVKQ